MLLLLHTDLRPQRHLCGVGFTRLMVNHVLQTWSLVLLFLINPSCHCPEPSSLTKPRGGSANSLVLVNSLLYYHSSSCGGNSERLELLVLSTWPLLYPSVPLACLCSAYVTCPIGTVSRGGSRAPSLARINDTHLHGGQVPIPGAV